MVNTLDIPEGVRLGNERLILVTEAAGSKLRALIEREIGRAIICASKLLAVAAMGLAIR